MTPLEGALGAVQVTKSLARSILVARPRLDAVDEDFCAVAGSALAGLDEARAIGVHPRERVAQGRAELGLADPAVVVGVQIIPAVGTAHAPDLDPLAGPAFPMPAGHDRMSAGSIEDDDLAFTAGAGFAADEDHGPLFTLSGFCASLATGMVTAQFEAMHPRAVRAPVAARTAQDPDLVVAALAHGAVTGVQFPGRQAAVAIRVHPREMIVHRRGELLTRDLTVAVLVEPAGAVAAQDHDAGADFGRGVRRGGRRGLLYQGGGKGDQGQHEGSAPVVVRSMFDHDALAVVFQLVADCFNAEMTGSAGFVTMTPMQADAALHILVVDDDPGIREVLCDYLIQHGYDAVGAASAAEMDRAVARRAPDLIVLDLMMPGEDGLSVCRRLAGKGPPIVMLSAMGEDTDRIIGLELGADDYLPKPCNPRELLARVRAVLRRPREEAAAEGPTLTFAGWRLNLLRRELTRPDGRAVALSAGEFALLRAFAERPGRLLTRDQLLERARGADADIFDRAMDVQISRLRKKLDDGSGVQMIQTLRGEGYMFDVRVARCHDPIRGVA